MVRRLPSATGVKPGPLAGRLIDRPATAPESSWLSRAAMDVALRVSVPFASTRKGRPIAPLDLEHAFAWRLSTTRGFQVNLRRWIGASERLQRIYWLQGFGIGYDLG